MQLSLNFSYSKHLVIYVFSLFSCLFKPLLLLERINTLKPCIPNGGFLAAKYTSQDFDDLDHRLKQTGAQTIVFPNRGVILAAWNEFFGQALWSDKNAAICYDLDLTNAAELRKLVGMNQPGYQLKAGHFP